MKNLPKDVQLAIVVASAIVSAILIITVASVVNTYLSH